MGRVQAALAPKVLPVKEYLGSALFVTAILEVVTAAVLGGLAISRSTSHHLTGAQLAFVLALGAAAGAVTAWLNHFFIGLSDTSFGLVSSDDPPPSLAGTDPLSPGVVWRRALISGALAGLWGVGLALLVFAAMNRKLAGFPIVFVGILVTWGIANLVTAFSGRVQAIRIGLADEIDAAPRPARRRAWRQIALPLAGFIGLTNAGIAWILFHDYSVGGTFAVAHTLTEQQALSDATILILFSLGIARFVSVRAGRAEAKLGLVSFEDVATQVPTARSLFGPQGLVYIYFGGIVLASLIRFVLPALPNLAEVMVARGVLAAAVAFCASGLSYIRGAANTAASA